MSIYSIQIVIGFAVGFLFIVSYFFSDKNFLFQFLAYFPRKRKGSVKIGSLIFGLVFVLISTYYCFLLYL